MCRAFINLAVGSIATEIRTCQVPHPFKNLNLNLARRNFSMRPPSTWWIHTQKGTTTIYVWRTWTSQCHSWETLPLPFPVAGTWHKLISTLKCTHRKRVTLYGWFPRTSCFDDISCFESRVVKFRRAMYFVCVPWCSPSWYHTTSANPLLTDGSLPSGYDVLHSRGRRGCLGL